MTETRTIQLPEALPPVTTRMVTDRVPAGSGTIAWETGKEHPLIQGAVIVRMYVIPDGGGVDVYSVLAGGREAARHHIPDVRIHITEESMPIDILIKELEVAESTEEDDEDEDEDEDEEEDEVIETAPPAPAAPTPVVPTSQS